MNGTELEEALAGRLRLLSRDEPDLGADVRAAQRARLVAMAAVRTPEVRPSRWRRLLTGRVPEGPVRPWATRLKAGVAGAALTVAALSGLAALAQGAEPGDLLYDLKRGTEETRLALAADSERGLTLLDFASTRLTELSELTGGETGALPAIAPSEDGTDVVVAADSADAGTVRDVLATMDDQTTEGTYWLTGTAWDGGDAAALATLLGWADQQRAGLGALTVPAAAADALAQSLTLVDTVAARGAALQAALSCGAPLAGRDELGPVPAECGTAAPGTPSSATAAPGTEEVPATTAATAPATSDATTPTTGAGGGGAATTQAPAVPTVVPPVPTSAVPTTSSPIVQVPLPLPSTTVCVGSLICVGG